MDKVFLTDDNFYQSFDGPKIKGGERVMYQASLVIRLGKNGNHKVLKDRYGLTEDEINAEIEKHLNPVDNRLLLLM
jgi:hypothetical protein